MDNPIATPSPFINTDPKRWQGDPAPSSPFLVVPKPVVEAPTPSPFLVVPTAPTADGAPSGGSQPTTGGTGPAESPKDSGPAPVGPNAPFGVVKLVFKAGKTIVTNPGDVAHRTIDQTTKPLTAGLDAAKKAGVPGTEVPKTLVTRWGNGAHRVVKGSQRMVKDPAGALRTSVAVNAGHAKRTLDAAGKLGVPGTAQAKAAVDVMARGADRLLTNPIDAVANGAHNVIDKAEAAGVPGMDAARTVTDLAHDGARIIVDKADAGATVITDAGRTLWTGAGQLLDSVFGD